MASVEFVHVTKRYGRVEAVSDLSLRIADGEFMTLVGPSGCGKSTTLNMLAGLDEVSAGEILIDDEAVTGMPASERDIAMVFQSYALYPHVTVRDNLGFALKVHGEAKAAIAAKVDRAAAMLGIADLLDRKPRQLSGGQRQRVALGRALVREPRLFLLDEPLSNLDAKLRVQMRAELRLLFDRLETTVVFVTHDQAEAMTLSDRVAIFDKGVVQQVGTPMELYDAPANTFVAGFLGSPPMTFLEATVADGAAGSVLAGDGFAFAAPEPRDRLQRGQEVVVGIRPEDIQVSRDATSHPAATAISLVEPMGSTTIVYAPLGGKLIAIETDKGTDLAPGDAVGVGVDPGRLHLFDPKTGRSLAA
ncbi:MAG: ABC transporter ATP-binding protein [Chloroflexia bacterium]|nr:ABC transporter ATP-binding protein [Chloroflexia bacterium]